MHTFDVDSTNKQSGHSLYPFLDSVAPPPPQGETHHTTMHAVGLLVGAGEGGSQTGESLTKVTIRLSRHLHATTRPQIHHRRQGAQSGPPRPSAPTLDALDNSLDEG